MKLKKLTALCLAGIMAIGILAGCSKTEETKTENGQEKITIRLLTRMAGTSPQVGIYNDIIDEFKAMYPEVEIVDDSKGDDDSFNNILKTDMASGTMANIFRIQGVANLSDYIDQGYLLDVTPYLKADDAWNHFTEGSVSYYEVPGKDGVYGVPCEAGLIGVYYNERIFTEAGIESFPETWSELLIAIEKIKEIDVTPIAMGAKTSYMAGHLHNNIFYKYMGTEAAKKLGNRELAWNDPDVVQSLQYVKDLNDMGAFSDGAAGLSDDVVKTDFQNGDAAMMITGPWNITSFNNPETCPEAGNIKLAKFPYFDEKPEFKDEDMQVISPYMINGKLEGRELELTMELVKMLTGKAAAERFANETAQLIPRTDIEVDKTIVDPLFTQNVDFCATSTGVAVDVFDFDSVTSMQDRTRNSIVSMFTGASAQEAANEIQAEVDK